MSSMALPPQAFIKVLDNAWITKFNAVAATAWLLYDYFISLNDEIELIWKSRTSVPKLLYFIARYFGLFMQIFFATGAVPMYCLSWLIFESASFVTLVCAVEISMILRVQALYGGNRIVLMILMLLLFGEAITFGVVAAMGFVVAIPGLIPFPAGSPIRGCVMSADTTFFMQCWVPTLIFEFILFALMAYKCLRNAYGRKTPLHVKFFKDGTVYFALMFVALLFYTISWHIPGLRLTGGALVRWLGSVISYSGAHLLLSIRRLVRDRMQANQLEEMADMAVDSGLARVDSTSSAMYPVSETWSQSTKVGARGSGSEASMSDTAQASPVSEYLPWPKIMPEVPEESRTTSPEFSLSDVQSSRTERWCSQDTGYHTPFVGYGNGRPELMRDNSHVCQGGIDEVPASSTPVSRWRTWWGGEDAHEEDAQEGSSRVRRRSIAPEQGPCDLHDIELDDWDMR